MYYGARYYEASVGRFTSADPAAIGSPKDFLADPQQLNLYAYARNNPLKYTDPSGEFAFLIPIAIGLVMAIYYDVNTANSTDVSSSDLPRSYSQSLGEAISPEYKALPGPVKFVAESLAFGGLAGALEKTVGSKVAVSLDGALERNLSTGAKNGIADGAKFLQQITSRTGNFGIGSAEEREAIELGKEWMGEGYREIISGDKKIWYSSDGLKQFRLPSYKPKLDKIQANFEFRTQASGSWLGNGHLDIN